jgi:RimJ/RimL family protein N-acetyltransferase
VSSSSDFQINAGRGVVLRRLNGADLAAFQAYRRDPEVGKYQDWSRMDDAEALGFLNHMAEVDLFQRGRWSQIGIALNGGLIGDMGVLLDADAPEAEVGVTLAASAQRKGLGEVAVRALFSYLFDDLGLERIIAGADLENARSIALMERLGMEKTGAANGDVDYVLHRAN